jgi:hypothetical protein
MSLCANGVRAIVTQFYRVVPFFTIMMSIIVLSIVTHCHLPNVVRPSDVILNAVAPDRRSVIILMMTEEGVGLRGREI